MHLHNRPGRLWSPIDETQITSTELPFKDHMDCSGKKNSFAYMELDNFLREWQMQEQKKNKL